MMRHGEAARPCAAGRPAPRRRRSTRRRCGRRHRATGCRARRPRRREDASDDGEERRRISHPPSFPPRRRLARERTGARDLARATERDGPRAPAADGASLGGRAIRNREIRRPSCRVSASRASLSAAVHHRSWSIMVSAACCTGAKRAGSTGAVVLHHRHVEVAQDVDAGADRRHLQFDRDEPHVLDRAGAAGRPVADEADRLPAPFRIDPVEGVLHRAADAPIVFRRDDDEAVLGADRLGPAGDVLLLERLGCSRPGSPARRNSGGCSP